MDEKSLGLTVQDSISFYNTDPEIMHYNITNGFNKDDVNPEVYITSVKNDLSKNGLSYSYLSLHR